MNVDSIIGIVYSAVYQNLGGDYENDSDERADTITRKIESLSEEELFDKFLVWHGIIGYTDLIIMAYEGTIGLRRKK